MTLETPRELLDTHPAPATRAKVTHDPVAVCMLLMFNGQHALAASTARRFLREAGVNVQTPEQAAKFRSQRYAVMGGKP